MDIWNRWSLVTGIRRRPLWRIASTLGAVGALLASGLALAAAGALDPGFGNAGLFIPPKPLQLDREAFATAIQPDGKVVVAGAAWDVDMQEKDLALWRLTPEGKLDLTFNGAGGTGLSLPGHQWGRAVAIDPLGRIVVAGSSYGSGAYQLLVARFNPDGTPDPSFNQTGYVIRNFGPGTVIAAFGVAVQRDGRILIAGASPATGGNVFGLARFDLDGQPDPTFGGGDGFVTTDFGRASAESSALAIQPDGRIVVAGLLDMADRYDIALARYLPDGSLDLSFDGDGRVTTDFGGDEYAAAVAIQPNGMIVVAGGAAIAGQWDFALARYRKNGRLDRKFGRDGKVTTGFVPGGMDFARGLAIQRNGRLVVVGAAQDAPNANEYSFAVARYLLNGRPDRTFGIGGRLVTGSPNNHEHAWGVAIQPDGKIVVAGSTINNVAVARYLAR